MGETLVATPYGQVPIATISVGQQVTAFNIIGDREPRHVLNVFEYHDRDTWRLEVESVGEILVTGEHPFKVPGGGDEYLTVDDMVVGDLLLTEEGETVEVVSKTPGPSRTVHNLNVEGLHTYMAGGLRVHNEK